MRFDAWPTGMDTVMAELDADRLAALAWNARMDLMTLTALRTVMGRLDEDGRATVLAAFTRAGRLACGAGLPWLAAMEDEGCRTFNRLAALVERLAPADAAVVLQAIVMAGRSGHGLDPDGLERVTQATLSGIRTELGSRPVP